MVDFTGFSPESLDFLTEIKAHNSKLWFESRRSEYERLLLNPFRSLVTDLTPAALSVDPAFEVRPSVNRTISKIFRDTRFSADKSLFRDVMWLVFKRPGRDWTATAPGFYFEMSPRGYRYGAGFYSPAPSIMTAFREHIDDDPDAFSEVIAFMTSDDRYELAGEPYKRPVPSTHPPVIDAWYQMKYFYLVANRPPDDLLFSPELADELEEGFIVAAPLYRYLAGIVFD